MLLICDWLRGDPRYHTAAIRVAPGNVHSRRVPVAAGFTRVGRVVSPDGEELIRYDLALARG